MPSIIARSSRHCAPCDHGAVVGNAREPEVRSEGHVAEARRGVLAHQVDAVARGIVLLEGRHPAAAARAALAMVDDGRRLVAHAIAALLRAADEVGLLVVHEEPLVQQAARRGSADSGHERATEARRREVVAAHARRGAVRLAGERVAEDAEAPVEAAGVRANQPRVGRVQDLRHDDRSGSRPRRTSSVQEVRRHGDVVVEEEREVVAVLDARCGCRCSRPLRSRRSRGSESLLPSGNARSIVVHRAIGDAGIDDDEPAIRVLDLASDAQNASIKPRAVVVDDDDRHRRRGGVIHGQSPRQNFGSHISKRSSGRPSK